MNTPPSPALDSTYLAQQSEQLTRLARQLIGDAHLAEELVQDTWLKVLTAGGPLVPEFLRRTLRNATVDRRRQRASRTAREQAAARREAQPPADEAAQRLDTLELLAGALRRLGEPGCSTLTRLFFDDLKPAAIARQDGVSVEVVYQRRLRALEALRVDLDRRGGGRERWMQALLPLAFPPRAARVLALPSLAQTSLLAALGLTAMLVAALWFDLPVSRSSSPVASASAAAAPSAAPPPPRPSPALSNARREVDSSRSIEVQVVHDGTAEPVPAATVHWWPLPAEHDAAAQVETWFRLGILEERTRVGSSEHQADDSGQLNVPLGEHGFLAIASHGDLWGYTVATHSSGDSIRLGVRQDSDLLVTVRDSSGALIEGVMVHLAQLGYGDTAYLSALTNANGQADLRHVGAIKNSPSDPGRATAAIFFNVYRSSPTLWSYLPPEELTQHQEIHIPWDTGHFNVEIVEETTGALIDNDTSLQFGDQIYVTSNGRARIAARAGSEFEPSETNLSISDANQPPRIHSAGEQVPVRLILSRPSTPRQKTTLVGRILSNDGVPLGNANICLHRALGYADHLHGDTDGSGRFELNCDPEVTPSEVSLGRLGDVDPNPEQFVPYINNISIQPGLIELGDLRPATPHIIVSGRTIDNRGAPIANALVTLSDQGSQLLENLGYVGYWNEVRTRDDGRFEFPSKADLAEIEDTITILVVHDDFGTVCQEVAIGSRDVNIALSPARALSGTILVDSSMRPEDLWVQISSFAAGLSQETAITSTHASKRTRLRADGSFSISRPTSDCEIRVLYCGPQAVHAPVLLSSHVVRHTEPSSAHLLTIDLRDRYRCILFTILDESSTPLHGVDVCARGDGYSASNTTDHRGQCELLVPNGSRAWIRSSDYHDDELATGLPEVTFQATRRSMLQFHLVGGRPTISEEFVLHASVESLAGTVLGGRNVPATGEFSARAPDRFACRVQFSLTRPGRRGRAACGSEEVVIDGKPGFVHQLRPLEPAVLDAAMAALESGGH
jgi:RNA polymerase sigma factor (sigma-70 family)